MKTNIIDFSLKINDKSIFFVGALSPLRIWEENRITFKSLPTTQKHTLFNIYALLLRDAVLKWLLASKLCNIA